MFTPQMSPEYSPMHFPALVCQQHNEVYAPLKCDLHDSSRLRTLHPLPHRTRNMIGVITEEPSGTSG